MLSFYIFPSTQFVRVACLVYSILYCEMYDYILNVNLFWLRYRNWGTIPERGTIQNQSVFCQINRDLHLVGSSVPQWLCNLQGCSFQNLKCRCLLHCTRLSRHPHHHMDCFDGPCGQLQNLETTDQTWCCSVQGNFINLFAPQDYFVCKVWDILIIYLY